MNRIVRTPEVLGISLRLKSVRSGVSSAWYGHVPFAYWIIEATKPSIVVELGAHNGVSYSAFCDAVQKGHLDARCFAVDTWQGDDHAGWYDEDVYRDLAQFNDANFGSFSRLVRSTFAQALEHFADGSIDILHIDGRHSYEDVKEDFEQYLPKLSNKAVVLFHDINVRERGFGVWRFWDEVKGNHPSFEFYHSHGLGVLCIGSDVPEVLAHLTGSNEGAIREIREVFSQAGHICALESAVHQGLDLRAKLNASKAELTAKKDENASLLDQLSAAAEHSARLSDQIEELDAENLRLIEEAEEIKSHLARNLAKLARVKRLAASQEKSAFWLNNEVEELRQQTAVLVHNLSQAQQSTISQYTALLSSTTARLNAIEGSTAWRVTAPFRWFGESLPPSLRWHVRRGTKFAYWLATPWKMGKRLEFLRHRNNAPAVASFPAAEPASQFAPSVPDRFSLAHLPPAERRGEWPVVDWYDDDKPEVSIVILNWNRSEMTLRCLDYIFQHTYGARYEIVIVDNGSSPEEVQRLERLRGPARVVPIGVNRYFGEANNIGVEHARGEYICLLNNDAFVHHGWLTPLLDLLRGNPTIGAVGPKFLYPTGELQEAGALVQPDGSAVQLGKGDNINRHLYEKNRRVDYVSAACCLMSRETFLHVLGFDLMYDPAYYEDVDLCLKIRLAGLSTWYCSSSTVTHIENATSVGTRNNLGLGSVVEINRAKFVARWSEYLAGDKQAAPLLLPFEEFMPTNESPSRSVAIYTPYNLTPGGGERFLLTIAEAFRGTSTNVTLITPYPFSRLRILTMGRELGIKLDHLKLTTLDDARDLEIDHLFIIGNEITPPIRGFAARNTYICQFPFPNESSDYLARTRSNWSAVDEIVCYSEFVRAEIRKAASAAGLPEKPITILPAPVPMVEGIEEKARNRILHVGRFYAGGHSKRQDILIETAKKLMDAGHDVNLHFAGSLHPEPEHRAYYAGLIERASGYPIHFHVNCSPEQLAHLYRASSIYWHATGYGVDPAQSPERMEHFGISVIEAMSAGCIPIVYGEGGPRGIVRAGDVGYHFHTSDELFQQTEKLLGLNDFAFNEFAHRCKLEAEQYSAERFRQLVLEFSLPNEN